MPVRRTTDFPKLTFAQRPPPSEVSSQCDPLTGTGSGEIGIRVELAVPVATSVPFDFSRRILIVPLPRIRLSRTEAVDTVRLLPWTVNRSPTPLEPEAMP